MKFNVRQIVALVILVLETAGVCYLWISHHKPNSEVFNERLRLDSLPSGSKDRGAVHSALVLPELEGNSPVGRANLDKRENFPGGKVIVPWQGIGTNIVFSAAFELDPKVYETFGLGEDEAGAVESALEKFREKLFDLESSVATRITEPTGDSLLIPSLDSKDYLLRHHIEALISDPSINNNKDFANFLEGLITRSSAWYELHVSRKLSLSFDEDSRPSLFVEREAPDASSFIESRFPLDGTPDQIPALRAWLTKRYGHLIATDLNFIEIPSENH